MAYIIWSPKDDANYHPVYRPIVFHVQNDCLISGATLVGIKAKLNIYDVTGTLIKTIEVISKIRAYDTLSLFPIYKFDFSRYLQDFVSWEFNDINSGVESVDENPSILFDVWFANLYIDTDGLQQVQDDDFDTVQSGFLVGINATRQHDEWIDYGTNKHFTMHPFTVIPLASSNTRFLTNKPTPSPVALNESEYLSLIVDNEDTINGYKVEFYDSSGVIGNAYKYLTPATSTVDGVVKNCFRSIPVGPTNINNTIWDSSTGTTVINSSIVFYTIQAGIVTDSGGSFSMIYLTEKRRYNLVSGCDDDKRIHFVNLLGGIDSYTFKMFDSGKLKFKPSKWQKGLFFPHTIGDHGEQVQETITSENIIVSAKDDLDFKSCVWLSELASSPMPMLQIEGENYLPLAMLDNDVETTPNENGIYEAQFAFGLANSRISQRN